MLIERSREILPHALGSRGWTFGFPKLATVKGAEVPLLDTPAIRK